MKLIDIGKIKGVDMGLAFAKLVNTVYNNRSITVARLLDQEFKYVPASKTNIRKTFEKARKALRDKAKQIETEQQAVVRPMRKAKQ